MLNAIFNSENTVANIVGLISVLCGALVYGHRDRKKIVLSKLLADVLSALYYFLIGGLTGAYLNVVNIFRDWVFYHKHDKKWAGNISWVAVFLIINLISGIASWNGYQSLLPAIGSSFAVIGLWTSNASKVRLVSLIGVSLWLVYALIIGAVPTIIYNSLAIFSIIRGFVNDIKEKHKH